MNKTDSLDVYLIAYFAKCGRINECESRCGYLFLALKRLARHRLYLAENITREKTIMVSKLYLKFSELQLLDSGTQPFSNIYRDTSSDDLTQFMSPQEIMDASEEDLL